MTGGIGALPLRVRLALVATTLTLVGIALGLTIIYWSLYGLRLAGFDDESRLLAALVLESAVLREDQTVRIPRVLESYLTDESGASAAQAYVDGELIWEGGAIDAPRPLDPARLLEGRGARSVDDWRVYTARDEDASIAVQVGRPLLGVREVLGPLPGLALPLTLLLAALSGALAWVVVGVALRPLRRLTAAAEAFEAEGPVPALPGRDEPARLAQAFARLLARLRAEREREQRFLAYAAHELRTPISALRAGLETAASRGTAPGAEMLQRLLREAIRLELLARNLLALSRAEAGESAFEEIDLATVVEDAYDRFQPLALERGLELRLEAESVRVRADPRLLAQAIDNLVSNALRFARSGDVTLRSGAEEERGFLEVVDSGPGVVEPIRDGLGLRVVRAVARVHGGSVAFTAAGGTIVRLALPARPNTPSDGSVTGTGGATG